MEVQSAIIDPAIQYLVTAILSLIGAGVGAVVLMVLSQKKDVKELLRTNQLLAENIGSLLPCTRDIIKGVRSNIYATKEAVKDDDEAAIQSISNAMMYIGRAEDQLNCRADKNAGAAMAIGQ